MKGPVDTLPDAAPSPHRASWLPNRARWRFWAGHLGRFGAWQLASQALQFLTGFLLVRWMSIEAYAQYGVALSFQNMLNLLIDLGFSSSIIALVGERIHDREFVGQHIRAARAQRNGLLLILGPLSACGFFWLARAHEWPLGTSILLFSSILGLLFFQGWASCYAPPLLMHQQLGPLYRPGVALNAAKLAASGLLHLLAALSATAVCWINALTTMVTGWLYRASARPYLAEPATPDLATVRAIRRYVMPLAPGMIFYAFQGQIQVFLISVFGQTQSVAEVTALGRLGQLFLFLGAFNTNILAPYIARISVTQLAVRYFQAIVLAVTLGLVLSAAAFFFPAPFLWLLGAKYSGLQHELFLSIVTASLSFVSGTLYSLNNARRWVYHWTSAANIIGLIALQSVLVAIMDLRTTEAVMRFSVAAALLPLLVFAATALYGYRQTRAAAPVPSH
jgi:O-antigen/teichoic acid export membrane protein